MKKALFILSFIISNLSIVCAQTPVSGGIFSNTTWTLANSPYLMTGSIVVFPGATLTIEPGVEVRVQDNPPPSPSLYIESRGTINMVGSPGQPIRFRANSAIYTVAAWQGFIVNDAQGGVVNFDYVEISNANSTFNYTSTPPQFISLHGCRFNYNYYGIQSVLSLTLDSCFFFGNYSAVAGWSIFDINRCVFDSNGAALPIYASTLVVDSSDFINNYTAINLNNVPFSGMSISNCFFNNNGNGIVNPGNGSITNCTFSQNNIGIEGAVNAQITNSYFTNNLVAARLGFGSTLRDCEIANNTIGVGLGPLSFGQPAPNVLDNRICQNDSFNIENNTDLNLFLASNCFCESDSAVIESKILDGYDDITRGLISYAIYDTSCTTILRLINKANITGLEESTVDKFIVSPNPAHDRVSFQNLSKELNIELIDQFGKRVMSCVVGPASNSIDVSGLSKGLYIVHAINGDEFNYSKLLLQ